MDSSKQTDIRVAVLAVHGVADQQPCESARAISNLLLNLNDGGKPLYRSFRETAHRIQARAVKVVSRGADCRLPNPFKRWVADELKKPSTVPADHAFLRGQLECYRGEDPDDPHQTIRLEGVREGSSTRVHVYEMYWADLSRFGRGILRMLGEVYQILLHLPSVGVHTLRAAQLNHAGDAKWKTLVDVHSFAAWLLAVPIAMINLLMLAAALTVAIAGPVDKLPPMFQWIVSAGVLTAIIAGVASLVLYFRPKRRVSLAVLAVGALSIASLIVVYAYIASGAAPVHPGVKILFAGIGCLIATAWVAGKYEKRRAGVLRWGTILLLVTAAVFLWSVWMQSPAGAQEPPVVRYVPWLYLLRYIEVAAFVNSVLWGVFYATALTSFVLALFGFTRRNLEDRRACWTARLTMSLSPVAFALMTLVLWAGITSAFIPLLPEQHSYESAEQVREVPVLYTPLRLPVVTDAAVARPYPVARFGQELLVNSSLLIPFLLIGVVVAVIIAVVGLTPVVLREAIPPRGRRVNDDASERLGSWLTMANGALLWSGRVVYWTVTVAMPFVIILTLTDIVPRYLLRDAVWDGMGKLGAVVAGSAVGVFALGRNLQVLAGLLAPLDVVLDVDNYLREHPRDSNPTARIFARYASMLRSICGWRDPESGKPYDALIIVAHSQGTVITSDLLRFLRTESGNDTNYDSALAPILNQELPVYFFTMGSPLRNLYGRRFPHLYSYAYHAIDTPVAEYKEFDLVPPRPPCPCNLGVKAWINAFRSGDYIGRFLWRPDDCGYAWKMPAPLPNAPENTGPWDICKDLKQNISFDRDDVCREFCIGPGAHTHYWDDTAALVACEIDRIIEDCAKALPPLAAAAGASTQTAQSPLPPTRSATAPGRPSECGRDCRSGA